MDPNREAYLIEQFQNIFHNLDEENTQFKRRLSDVENANRVFQWNPLGGDKHCIFLISLM